MRYKKKILLLIILNTLILSPVFSIAQQNDNSAQETNKPSDTSKETTNTSPEKKDGEGFFSRIKHFFKGDDKKEESSPAPAPAVEKKADDNLPPIDPDAPTPEKRPESYKTLRLPSTINKKSYSRENQHLPKVMYVEEYKAIMFDSAASGNIEVLRTMEQYFQNSDIRDNDGNTPLIYATMAGNKDSIITLINANQDAQNYAGISSLHIAVLNMRYDIAEILLNRGANPDIADANGKTPLILATELNYDSIVELLLKYNASPDKRMKDGNSALHIAITKNNLNITYMLITSGANLEIRNFKGYTPLMLAAATGKSDIVSLLLEAGADPYKKNARGETIMQIAANSGYNNIAAMIDSISIQEELTASKLITMRQQQLYTEPADDKKDKNYDPNAPIPVLKPEKVSEPEKTSKTQNTKKLPKKIPVPRFSTEQEEKMNKQSLPPK